MKVYTHFFWGLGALGLAALAASAATCGCAGAPRTETPDPRVTRTYEVDHWVIRNPGRGWVQFVDLSDDGDVRFVEGLGVSLANARVRLDRFRDAPIDAGFLAELEDGFDAIRAAGIKLVLRFQYNIGSGKDPPLSRVLEHIDQLTPLVRRNADVIAVLQAGFIGAWGEWHTSVSGLTDRDKREKLLRKLLTALPENRSVQVRSPVFKQAFAGHPTSAKTALSSAPGARIGHHNDCLLANETDHGTFSTPESRAYLEADSAFVPVGGESCAPAPPRTDCENALKELRRYHYSYLNRAYHPEVIAGWKRQGCFKVIERDLGYRLVLRRASWPRRVAAGRSMEVSVRVENLGFAAPFAPRPVFLVIGQGPDRHVVELSDLDVRRWLPGQPYELTADVSLPEDLAAGTYPLKLWLPDEDPGLRARPEYAIRMSNKGTWISEEGTNLLGRLSITARNVNRASPSF